jgi:hypothetical protein
MATHPIVEKAHALLKEQRELLVKEREAIFTQQQALQEQLDTINDALAKFDVFEGKPAASTSRGRRAPVAGDARKGSKRHGIMEVIKDNPGGLSRGELLEKMGLKGDKPAEMSVSNALTGLAKAKRIVRNGGKYIAASA